MAMARGYFMKRILLSVSMSGVLLAGCAGYSPYEGPLVDMAGVDQTKYNNDLSECRHKKQNASFVGAGTMISDCMAERGYNVIEKRG
jgi:hypothetical protein